MRGCRVGKNTAGLYRVRTGRRWIPGERRRTDVTPM